ncbi:MAG: folate family ECF transporter S component, partial [Candidatus Atribacteria bacterium]|nr:folate family ECF transporter S component [Candidatus Atribacteria bacterium]
ALSGMIPALVLSLFRKEEEPKTLELGIAITLGHIMISLMLIPYFLNSIFGIPWAILLPARMIAAPINILIYVYIIKIMLKRNIFNFVSGK